MAEENDHGIEPTEEELIQAFAKAKAKGYKSSAIKAEDAATEVLRGFLPPRCHHIGLGRLRILAQNLSKAGKEPGERKRKPSQNASSAINQLVRAYPPRKEHSEEYKRLHASEEFREHCRNLKVLLDFACLLCCRHFPAARLEGHIRDYSNWRKPFNTLILCPTCHGIADAMRRFGQDREVLDNGKAACGIFDLAESPPPAEEEEEIRF